MAKEKIKCVVRGKIQELSPTAYEIAKEYFGAVKASDLKITKPIELSKPILTPKINVKVEKPEELTIKKTEAAKILDAPPPEGPMITERPAKKVTKPRAKKK